MKLDYVINGNDVLYSTVTEIDPVPCIGDEVFFTRRTGKSFIVTRVIFHIDDRIPKRGGKVRVHLKEIEK